MYHGLYRNPQEAEEAQYAFSRMFGPQNLNQALYEESKRNQPLINHTTIINDLLNKGLTCIISEWTEYCHHTDAIIGVNVELKAAFPESELARAYFQDNYAVDNIEELDDNFCTYLKYPNGRQSYSGDEVDEGEAPVDPEEGLYSTVKDDDLPF